jgi:hypothetical protein
MRIAHLFLPLALGALLACTPAGEGPPPAASTVEPAEVDAIMGSLAVRDFAALAERVADDGLLVSPYLTIEPGHLRLSRDEVARCGTDPRVRDWGTWDGRGDAIRMTCADYFDRLVWVADFRAVRETVFDRPHPGSTDRDNHREVFPDAVVAWRHRPEYRDAAGQDHPWQSLHLIFVKRGTGWRLAAIVRGTRVI